MRQFKFFAAAVAVALSALAAPSAFAADPKDQSVEIGNKATKVASQPVTITVTPIITDQSITAHDGEYIIAIKGAHVWAEKGSHVDAMDGSFVTSDFGSTVTAYAGSQVNVYDGGHVIAKKGSYVVAENKILVTAEPGSTVIVDIE